MYRSFNKQLEIQDFKMYIWCQMKWEKNASRSETVTQQKISKQLFLYSIHVQTLYTIFHTEMPEIF